MENPTKADKKPLLSHREPSNVKGNLFYFAFKIFFASIICGIALLVLGNALPSFIPVSWSKLSLQITITVVCWLYYTFYVYTQSWSIGLHDYNAVLYEHKRYDPLRWLEASLLSQIPGVLLIIAALIRGGEPGSVYFIYANWLWVLYRLYATGLTWLFFAAPLWAVILAFVGYYLGYRQQRITDRLIFRKR